MRILLLALFFVLSLAPASKAQHQDPILTLPDGQVILNISATERAEVKQDLLISTLSFVSQNRDARAVQNEINSTMKKALDLVQKEETIKVNTGAYQVYETEDSRTKEKLWKGRQTLTLKSKDAETILDLSGKLQDLGLTMNGLSYTLDPSDAVDVQDGLMEDALKQLQERANRAAKALGKSAADLRDVNVQSQGMPRYAMRSEMMALSARSDMAPPVAAAGESTITLTVSARAILKP